MKILNDYSFVRGVCYGVQDDEEKIARELGYGARVGLNSVRFWLSYQSYFADRERFISRLVRFVRICYRNGYTSMPIIFNGNAIDPALLEPEFREKGDEYCLAIVDALKDEPGLLMWDIMNEPSWNGYVGDSQGAERQYRQEQTWDFVRHYCRLVREHDDRHNPITVGYAISAEADPTAAEVDVLSFHDYHDTRAKIAENYEHARELSEKYGIPVINTEMGCLARANPYDAVLEISHDYGFGWYVFELMISGRCDSEHGIFYPDGTIRNPSDIAAMMGCYRKRSGKTIPGLPNREKKAEYLVERLRKALTEYVSGDSFVYRRSDVSEMLDACEAAANLLECCELVPMAVPPTLTINNWRNGDPVPTNDEVRALAYELALTLKKVCQLI